MHHHVSFEVLSCHVGIGCIRGLGGVTPCTSAIKEGADFAIMHDFLSCHAYVSPLQVASSQATESSHRC